MATTHTPGPWVYDPDCGCIRSTDGRDWPVGEQGETGLSIEDEHARIRADRLIMAAGFDMLAALREIERQLQPGAIAGATVRPDEAQRALRVLRAAVAKAEGR